MTESGVPRIFSPTRAALRMARAQVLAKTVQEQRFLWKDICEDIAERLAFLRLEPVAPLIIGHFASLLHTELNSTPERSGWIVDGNLESPLPTKEHDFISVIGLLDAVNDLPGALIHIRNALVPGGLAIVSFVGGGSLPQLRSAMYAADGDRPAARIHPLVDPRAAPQLLQRAGWKDPVVDTRILKVRYAALDHLVRDLRCHGLTSALADVAPPMTKAARNRARASFLAAADDDGKVSETFEIITLTGRRSLAGT